MTPLRQKMIEDMQLRGLSARTQDSYVRAVRQLAEHYAKSPERVTEAELRQYFLYLQKLGDPFAGSRGQPATDSGMAGA
jgi:integrase/recombinase XerD